MPLRVALTGGIACGKSLAARFLASRGVECIDADDIVHGLLPDPAERKRIAAEVFADAAKRRALEARLHPLVKERIDAFLSSPSAGGLPRVAVVPLLFEANWDAEYDIICTVSSSRREQLRRMTEGRGWSREESEARLDAQLPVEEKAARSDYVILNDGSEKELEDRVSEFVKWLKEKIGAWPDSRP